MNGTDVTNAKHFAYITPGWKELRYIESFEPGIKYTSYVHMIPEKACNMFLGDIYVLRGDEIVGLLGEMEFRRIPRALLGAMFAIPAAAVENTSATQPTRALPNSLVPAEITKPSRPHVVKSSSPNVVFDEPAVITDCFRSIGQETGYPLSDLTDEATFPELGISCAG